MADRLRAETREVAQMSEELQLRLVEAEAPDGEIAVSDLVAIAQSLQEVSLRITRDCVDAEPLGRPPRVLDELSQLRLRGISKGSTRLVLARGPSGALDLDLPVLATVDQRFGEIIHAMGEDRRPEWVTDSIGDSVADLVRALKSAAPVVEARMGAREPIRIQTKEIHRETWTGAPKKGELMRVTGRLEKVDLRSHDFRIRDDVGNSIELKHVADDEAVAGLIGRQVAARGEAVHNQSGRVIGLTGPELRPDDSALTQARVPPTMPLSAILAAAPGLDPDGVVDLTDKEFEAFLDAARS